MTNNVNSGETETSEGGTVSMHLQQQTTESLKRKMRDESLVSSEQWDWNCHLLSCHMLSFKRVNWTYNRETWGKWWKEERMTNERGLWKEQRLTMNEWIERKKKRKTELKVRRWRIRRRWEKWWMTLAEWTSKRVSTQDSQQEWMRNDFVFTCGLSYNLAIQVLHDKSRRSVMDEEEKSLFVSNTCVTYSLMYVSNVLFISCNVISPLLDMPLSVEKVMSEP